MLCQSLCQIHSVRLESPGAAPLRAGLMIHNFESVEPFAQPSRTSR